MSKFAFTRLLERRIHTRNRRLDILTCVGTLAGCTLIGLLFYFLRLSEANIITIYILGILLISAVTKGHSYGAVSSVIGVLLFNCLFAEPRFTLTVYDPQYTITIIVMLFASLLTSYAMGLLRRQLEREMQETRRSELLLEMSRLLQDASNEADALDMTATQLHKLSGDPTLLFPVQAGLLLPPLARGQDAAQTAALQAELEPDLLAWAAGADGHRLHTLPCSHGTVLCYKMETPAAIYAIICIRTTAREDTDEAFYNPILPLLDLAANYIEKERLHAHNAHIAQEAEAERLRANLLRTISHDLRTPLTSILGNADVLLGNAEKLSYESRAHLYRNIHDDAQWLIGLVENLLFITRMENGAMQMRMEPEVLQDVLPEALRYLGKRTDTHRVSLELPEELLLARMDARLLLQVIINIVDNALTYTPAGSAIQLLLYRQGGDAMIEVRDEGPGISDTDKIHVFDMFYTANNVSGDGRRGIGLGLALCQSIVAAHGGAIYIRDNTPQGTIVGFTLQLEEVPHEAHHPGD